MKKTFLVLVLATLTLSACGAKNEDKSGSTTENSETGMVQKNESKSLKELLGLGKAQKCTYEFTDGEQKMKGEVWVDGKNFRQSTEISNDEGTMKVYAISKGDYFYSWGDTMKGSGIKMKIEPTEGAENSATKEGRAEQINLDDKYNYNCSPATLNEGDFALPTDVKFTDLSEGMKNLQNLNLEELKKMTPQE